MMHLHEMLGGGTREARRAGLLLMALGAFLLGGCAAFQPPRIDLPAVPQLASFSSVKPGEELPGGWRVWTLSRFKKPTDYQLVRDGDKTVVSARADGSASGLLHPLRVDPRAFPVLRWRWKVDGLIDGADNTSSDTEDSPVRIIIAFEGDTSRLDMDDRLFFSRIRLMTGMQMPYATLMYIWENKADPGTVIASRHTSRVRMIVADSGVARLNTWREERRNLYEDFRRVFGEEPGMIQHVAIMTDTDNTGAKVQALYGDIAFEGALPALPANSLD